jgi:hypothetical protein
MLTPPEIRIASSVRAMAKSSDDPHLSGRDR